MNIKCTDINKVYKLNAPRIKYNSPANKFFEKNQQTLPIGYIADKYGKNHGWSVCEHKWNLSDLSITYTIILDQNKLKTKSVTATKEDICSEFNWKDFKVINDCSIISEEFSEAELEEKERNLKKVIEATKKRDSKRVVKTTEDPIVNEVPSLDESFEEIPQEEMLDEDDDNE